MFDKAEFCKRIDTHLDSATASLRTNISSLPEQLAREDGPIHFEVKFCAPANPGLPIVGHFEAVPAGVPGQLRMRDGLRLLPEFPAAMTYAESRAFAQAGVEIVELSAPRVLTWFVEI